MNDIYIRADGNDIIGAGHVMRCLSIAEQLRNMGEHVVFLMADHSAEKMVRDRDFDLIVLNSIWNDLDSEIEIICELLQKNCIKKVLLDSYCVTQEYMSRLREFVKLIYIDDMLRYTYPVDTVIHYNPFDSEDDCRKRYNNTVVKFLVGSKYIPLREEFCDVNFDVRDCVRKILITTGGTDNYNIAGRLLEKICDKKQFDYIEFHVIVGMYNKNKAFLNELVNNNTNIVLHKNVNNMSEIMCTCDVAVSASGSTLYELCACGLPTICFSIADNQDSAWKWEQNDIMLYSGNAALSVDDCVNKCIENLDFFIKDKQEREKRSIKMRKVIDGLGAYRIAKSIVSDL